MGFLLLGVLAVAVVALISPASAQILCESATPVFCADMNRDGCVSDPNVCGPCFATFQSLVADQDEGNTQCYGALGWLLFRSSTCSVCVSE